jgi:hypothetical protein
LGSLRANLESALSQSSGERNAAKFFRDNPELVVWGFCRTGGHSKYVLYECLFGSSYRADFVVPLSYSGTWEVSFIELEPVDDIIINKGW